jgi:hypothetical protein
MVTRSNLFMFSPDTAVDSARGAPADLAAADNAAYRRPVRSLDPDEPPGVA